MHTITGIMNFGTTQRNVQTLDYNRRVVRGKGSKMKVVEWKKWDGKGFGVVLHTCRL